MTTLLSLIAALGFALAAGPIAYRVYKTPKLVGWSLLGYVGLTTAVWATQIQLALTHNMSLFFAQGVNTTVVSYCLVSIWRKG